MDSSTQSALAALGGTVLGVAGKWLLERLLNRAAQVEEAHAASLERKVDLLLQKVSAIELSNATATERALTIQAQHEELKRHLTEVDGRIKGLEAFQVEIRTRLSLKEGP